MMHLIHIKQLKITISYRETVLYVRLVHIGTIVILGRQPNANILIYFQDYVLKFCAYNFTTYIQNFVHKILLYTKTVRIQFLQYTKPFIQIIRYIIIYYIYRTSYIYNIRCCRFYLQCVILFNGQK